MIVYPVGLEKMIPSVEEASRMGGIFAIERSIGARVGMVCVADGIVYTELDALEDLFDVDAVHFASGGYGGAEGVRDHYNRRQRRGRERMRRFYRRHKRGAATEGGEGALQDLSPSLQFPGHGRKRPSRLPAGGIAPTAPVR